MNFTVDYFYQNQFLSNGPNVVFEFRLSGCKAQSSTPALKGTINFGDGKSQALTNLNCERWRVPHTYYSKPAGPATLTVPGGSAKAGVTLAALATAPSPAPSQIGGGDNSPSKTVTDQTGGGGKQPSQTATETFNVIFNQADNGLLGYVVSVKAPDGGSIESVKQLVLANGKQFHQVDSPDSTCSSPRCVRFRAALLDPSDSSAKSQVSGPGPITVATVTAKIPSGGQLTLSHTYANDLGSYGKGGRVRVLRDKGFKIEKAR